MFLSPPGPVPRPGASALALLAGAIALASLTGLGGCAKPTPQALPPAEPTVAEVPSRPAFVRPPGEAERSARVGQSLPDLSLLRTQRPGRMQVDLPDGRRFRLGGDAVARLTPAGVDLERGRLIAWIDPGRAGGARLSVRTRLATASIEGTTVFLDLDGPRLLLFSWEGRVRVTPAGGAAPVVLNSGDLLLHEEGVWRPRRRLERGEALRRRRSSDLLNGFQAPMATLPAIERELDRLGRSAPAGDGP